MRVLVMLLACATAPALAQHQGHGSGTADDPHAGHGPERAPAEHREHRMPQDSPVPDEDPPTSPPPPEAFAGPRHAADRLFDAGSMAAARERLLMEEGGMRSGAFVADRIETGFSDGEESYLWDVQGWYGGDIHRLWLKSEGEGLFDGSPEAAELQALYSRAVTPFFDLQAGLRYDVRPDPERAYLVLGLQGLAPYLFEVDVAAFLSDEGDLTARIEGEYDLRITQRLLLQPRLELEIAAQDVPELAIGSGFSTVEAGLRLRYEIRRELAPYLGVGWQRKLGATEDLARVAGDEASGWTVIFGLRGWY
jgi:copper resistance protein B